MTAAECLIATAEDQVGYMGKKSNAQLDNFKANTSGLYNKFARDLDALGDFYNGRKNGYDWCDVFVDWCFYKTFGRALAQKLLCQPDKSLGAGTGYSMRYYQQKGRLFTSPQPGDQVFFGTATTTDHTGIVSGVNGGYVHTIEGNCGSPSAVRTCKYPVGYARIKGYGRPDWSIVPEDKPEPEDGNDDDKGDDEMTEDKVREIVRDEWSKMEAERAEKPVSDWAKAELAAAVEAGITDGKRPRSYVTREEAAVMVLRGKI